MPPHILCSKPGTTSVRRWEYDWCYC